MSDPLLEADHLIRIGPAGVSTLIVAAVILAAIFVGM